MGQFYTDFNGYTVGSQPAGTTTPWNTGSYTVNTADLGIPALKENHGAGNAEYAIYWNHVPTTATDVEILFKGRTTVDPNASPSNDYEMEAVLRGGGGASTKYGYTVNFLGGLFTNIEGYNNNSSFTLGGGNNFNYAANTWYWLRARFEVGAGNTTTVRYRVWQDGNAEPGTWTEQYADNRFTHNGWIGLSSYNGDKGGTRYYSSVGIGWNGDPAPSSMPSQFLGIMSNSGDSILEATGTVIHNYQIAGGTRDAVEASGTTNSAEQGSTTTGRLDGTRHYGGLFTGMNIERGTRVTGATFKFPLLANYSGLGVLTQNSLYSYNSWAANTNYANSLSSGTAGGTYYNTAQVQTGRSLNPYPIAGSTLNDSASQWQTVGVNVQPLLQEWLYSRMWMANNTDFGVVIKGSGSTGNYIQPYHYDFGSTYGATLQVTEAINTGYRNGTTVTTSTLGGTTWTNPSNITATDGTTATTGSGSGGWQSDYINITGFGFTVPSNMNINGVTVRIKGSGSSAVDETVQLIVGGTAQGFNNAASGSLPGTNQYMLRGNAESTWNIPLTAAQVNASDFGVRYAVRNTSGGGSAAIDAIEVCVWYGESPKLVSTQVANNAAVQANGTGLPFYTGGHTYFEQKITLTSLIQLKKIRYWFAAVYFPENLKTGDPETNFIGQPFQLGLWTNETDLRAWTTGNAVQVWTKYLTSNDYDPYDFDLTSTPQYASGTTLYIGIKLTGTAVNGFTTVYMNGDGLTDDPNSVSYFTNTAPGGTWTSQAADLAYDLMGVIIPPPVLGDSLQDANSDLTATGVVTKLGTANTLRGNSWVTNTIASRVIDQQQTSGGFDFLIGYSDPDPKFGDQTIWRGGQYVTASTSSPVVAGFGFQTYGISGTEQVIVNFYPTHTDANAGTNLLGTKTVTLTDNYNEGTGVGTQTWYDAFLASPFTNGSASLFVELRRPSAGSQSVSVVNRSNSSIYAGGDLYLSEIFGTGNAAPSYGITPKSHNGTTVPNSDMVFRFYTNVNVVGAATLDNIEGDSDFFADGQRVQFGTMADNGNSDITVSGIREQLGVMTNTADSIFSATADKTGVGVMSNTADSNLAATANVGYFVNLGFDADVSLTAVGSKLWEDTLAYDADSDLTANGLRIPLGQANLIADSAAEVDATGIEITHLAITKSYLYKIYDQEWNFLGIWKDVISDFQYSQEINSAGSAISVTLARNSDSKVAQYDALGTDDDEAILTDDNNELAAETQILSSIGPGTTVDLNLNVKIYEFSTGVQPVEGDLVFTGYISMYTSQYGSTENTVVSIFSYGADLDNWVITEPAGDTRVPYLSYDPGVMLKDSLDRFNADGGIITYDEGVPGPTDVVTNLITNPSLETNSTGWSASLGIGTRTNSGGGAVGSYYYSLQNMGGASADYTTGNLVAGTSYRFSIYLKRPASGSVNVHGAHNSATVFDLNVSPPNSWTRYDVLFTASANSPLFFSVSIVGSDNIVYMDGAMLTAGTTLHDYFDGSTTDSDPATTYAWTGTAHASTSTKSTVISNVGASVEEVGWYDPGYITTYTFNVNTELEVIKKGLELAPTDWFFYTDLATNLLHFHPRPSEPAHYFYLGKHILGLDLEKTIEGIVNDVIFTGGKPTNLSLDRFFGTDGTALTAHSGETDATWTKHANSAAGTGFTITNANRVRPNSSGEQLMLVSANSPSSDYELEMDYWVPASGPASGDLGLAGRVQTGALTYYLARIWNDSTVQLYKCIAGTYTLLQSAALQTALAPGQTRNMKFKMEGAQLTVTVDGTAYVDIEDRSIIYGTRAGMRSGTALANNTTGLHADNFQMRLLSNDNAYQVFKRYEDTASIAQYRRGLARMTDNRVTLESSADIIVASQLERNKNPRYRSNITISGSTYDIRSIKLGDLVGFRNFDNFIDDPENPVWMQVVRIDYSGDKVALQLDTLLPSVPKRLEDIKRNLAQAEVADNPDAPTT